MKKIYAVLFFIIICFLAPYNVFAWSDNSTHPLIMEEAIKQSSLVGNYLQQNLGFKNGLDEIISAKDITPKKSIFKTLSDGARTEDTGIYKPGELTSCSRGLNHFYDPSKKIDDESAGLNCWTFTSNKKGTDLFF